MRDIMAITKKEMTIKIEKLFIEKKKTEERLRDIQNKINALNWGFVAGIYENIGEK